MVSKEGDRCNKMREKSRSYRKVIRKRRKMMKLHSLRLEQLTREREIAKRKERALSIE
jgi:hypothetical protein